MPKNQISISDGNTVEDLTNRALRVNLVAGSITLNGADGATVDGVTSSIRGTVLDYTNSNPVAVRLTDTNGDYVSPSGGGLTDAQLRATPVAVSGTFWQATQPVSGTFWQATQPVSGTFWQATQPVSASSLPLPTGASTDAVLTGGTVKAIVRGGAKGATSAADVTSTSTDANHQALDVNVNNSVGVTGTFWQATQPVSGTFWQATQPVSGTFWQATQPISAVSLPLPTNASTDRTTAAAPFSVRLSDGTAFYDGTKTGQLPAALVGGRLDENIGAWLGSTVPTVGSKASASCIPVVVASDQGAIAVTAPTLTKGTQGANGWSVQNLKDAGRVLKTYNVSALACVTSEALISLTPYADLTAGAGATTFAVTSGKRLRIQSITVTCRATSTVNVGGVVRLRFLAGTVLVSSPVHNSIGLQASNLATAVSGNAECEQLTFPDGLELSGTMQFGLTQLFSATSATIDVHVVGYEY